ncbi:hypothetical protein [Mesorhizobium sp. J8]|uniref:hypothetical protein n=1 Tax=Mesorhizobium sp. J8 TaxID=2777475 RepID=UPI0019167790|nr:hypothetical protein [Mesorhizobium sp. J8]
MRHLLHSKKDSTNRLDGQGICSHFVLMPESYGPKYCDYPLSNLIDTLRMVRVTCRYCKRQHNYQPSDLIQIFGDVDVDSLAERMTCETGGRDHGRLDVVAFVPTGREAVGLRIGRLVQSRSIACRFGGKIRREHHTKHHGNPLSLSGCQNHCHMREMPDASQIRQGRDACGRRGQDADRPRRRDRPAQGLQAH